MFETNGLTAGAAAVDITPRDRQFLYGYPHVARYSTGVHDPLFSSAFYLSDGTVEALLIANDVIYVSKALVARARSRIERRTSVPANHIMVTASHTHSGPVTVDCLISEADPAVPRADPAYLALLEEGIVAAAERAWRSARRALVGLVVARCPDVGTNRRDPAGPRNPRVPVLLARAADGSPIGAMFVCAMHPTVLHEDSTLISGDFPAMARQYLQEHVLGDCPVLVQTGPCGDQSPRHVTRANDFAEAERLGVLLGRAIERALADIHMDHRLHIGHRSATVWLPPKDQPTIAQAEARLAEARDRLEALRHAGASRQAVRTAECDWFGAQEAVVLARATEDGRIRDVRESCMPAEIQAIAVGPWRFVGWPGEIFVEYALRVEQAVAQCAVISLANGELQGYVVTPEAFAEGGYEASNGLFAPESGAILVRETLSLLSQTT